MSFEPTPSMPPPSAPSARPSQTSALTTILNRNPEGSSTLSVQHQLVLVEAADSLSEEFLNGSKGVFWTMLAAKFRMDAARSHAELSRKRMLNKLVKACKEELDTDRTGRTGADSELDAAVDRWIETLNAQEAKELDKAERSAANRLEVEATADLRDDSRQRMSQKRSRQTSNAASETSIAENEDPARSERTSVMSPDLVDHLKMFDETSEFL